MIALACALALPAAIAAACVGDDDSDNLAIAYVRQTRGDPSPSQIHLRVGGEHLEFEVPALTVAVRVSPSGDQLFAVSATREGTGLSLWDRRDGPLLHDALDIQILALAEWSPDGTRFVLNDGKRSLLYDSAGVRIATVEHSSLGAPLAAAWRPDSGVFVAGINPTIDMVSRDGALVASYELPREVAAHNLEYTGWTSSQTIALGWLENRVTSEVSVTVGGSTASVSEAATVDDLGPFLRFGELHAAVVGRFPEAQYLTSAPGGTAGALQPVLFVSPSGDEYTLWLALFAGDEPRFVELGGGEARSFDVSWRVDAVVVP